MFCESLGAQLAANFTKDDIPFLQLIGRESGDCNRLAAERAIGYNWRTTDGYRWRHSRRLIEPEMWAPGFPGSFLGVIIGNHSRLEDSHVSTGCNPLCVFNISNDAITNVLSKLSLFAEAERSGLQTSLIKYMQEKWVVHKPVGKGKDSYLSFILL